MIAFTIALTLTSLYAVKGCRHIRQYNLFHYSLALALLVIMSYLDLTKPELIMKNEGLRQGLYSFTSGTVATAFFVIVMFTGVLDHQWPVTRKLRSIRKELSIMATYLVLYHIGYNVWLYQQVTLSVLITGGLAALLLVPLFITSLTRVRKKLKKGQWRKIQKYAYGFYFLVYLHIVVANIHATRMDTYKVTLYTTLFLFYAYLRIEKARQNNRLYLQKAGGSSTS